MQQELRSYNTVLCSYRKFHKDMQMYIYCDVFIKLKYSVDFHMHIAKINCAYELLYAKILLSENCFAGVVIIWTMSFLKGPYIITHIINKESTDQPAHLWMCRLIRTFLAKQ